MSPLEKKNTVVFITISKCCIVYIMFAGCSSLATCGRPRDEFKFHDTFTLKGGIFTVAKHLEMLILKRFENEHFFREGICFLHISGSLTTRCHELHRHKLGSRSWFYWWLACDYAVALRHGCVYFIASTSKQFVKATLVLCVFEDWSHNFWPNNKYQQVTNQYQSSKSWLVVRLLNKIPKPWTNCQTKIRPPPRNPWRPSREKRKATIWTFGKVDFRGVVVQHLNCKDLTN